MIDFYTWITPNGLKISIALEEFGLPYKAHTIDITKGDQFSADYVAINPGSKSQPSSITKPVSPSPNPGPFFSISPKRQDGSCRVKVLPAITRSNG